MRRTTVIAAVLGLVFVLAALDPGGLRSGFIGAGGVPTVTDIQSVAVLPFDDLSGDVSNEQTTLALSSWVIMELGALFSPRKVSPWNSVRPIKEKELPLPEISRHLGVDGVVTGQVVYSGDQVMIAVTLYHGATETLLWSNEYKRRRGSSSALIGEIALDIAKEIGAALTAQQQTRLADAPSVNPEAEAAYLTGRYFLDQRDPTLLGAAKQHLTRAIELDPQLARAHAELAKLITYDAAYFRRPAHEVYPLAKRELMTALEIDPDLTETWEGLGWVSAHGEWDWTAAEDAYKHAISLNESFAVAHKSYGQFLVYTGRTEEGMAELRWAIEIDPLSNRLLKNSPCSSRF